ncbi:ATP-binding protein [Streptomyces sp. NPDC047042]|uniref:ATP-binding protein n=1 Tax=Streptomyces sp. NPDC047042 TaxID=3154807 RepID=UPI003410D27A
MAGSAGVAIPGETWALDWGLAMGISVANFAASRVDASAEGLLNARQFTRCHLQRWRLEETTDDVVTVVGELTSNAVRHTAAATDGVWLALAASPRTVMCVVRDPSSQVPARRTAAYPATGGRGLSVIAGLSCVWGWSVEGDGKAVWARVPI